MTTRHDPTLWSWIAPDGTEGTGNGGELRARLASGELPPQTLVWRRGWVEWLPARDVRQLGIGGGSDPKTSPHAIAPPPRPHALPRPAAVGKTAAPSGLGTAGRPRGPSVLGPPRGDPAFRAPDARVPLPTLGDDPPQVRGTLRPPRAVPPPPRGLTKPAAEPSSPRNDEDPPTRRPNPPPASHAADTAPDPAAASSALPSELRPALIVSGTASTEKAGGSRSTARSSAPAAGPDETPGSSPFEVTAQDFVELEPPSTTLESAGPAPPSGLPAPTASPRPLPPRHASPKRAWLSLAILGAVALAGLGAFALLKSGGEAREPAAAPKSPSSAASVPPPAEPAAPEPCRIVQPAARLAAGVDRRVMPLFGPGGEGRVRIGVATIAGRALGLSVETEDLDVERAFSEEGEAPIVAVVPLAEGPQSFVVDREGGDGRRLRTVAEPQRFAIGTLGDDWVRARDGSTEVLWAGAAQERTTDARVASGSGVHLLTFRRGGLSGDVYYGWLGEDGSAKSEPIAVKAESATLVGTPDVALSGDVGLIAFAGRDQPSDPWRLELARVSSDRAVSVRSFQAPAGGAGGENIAPSLAGLEQGFALQWTEGSSGQYQVRVQRLSRELEPIGEPLLVSSKGANAGQGALYAKGSLVVSVFIQTTAGHDELWGASLECP